MVAIALVTFLVYGRKTVPVNVAGWDVSRVAGTPRIGPNVISGKETSRLGVGQILETDHQSRASLRAEDIGQIEVEASTRLRLLTMGAGLKRIALDRGTIHTYIWAVPGQFVVDTPSAVTVDLGCAYTLQVDDSGAGLVRTSLGWVGFKLNGHESFIPPAQLARPSQKSVPVHRTSKMRPRSSAPLWRDSISRTAHLSNAPGIWRFSSASLANATHSRCGIC